MRGLTIIVAAADDARFRSALTLAAAHAALGGAARLFLDAGAVVLVREPMTGSDDAAFAAAGLPPLSMLVAEAMALGARIMLCQSGLQSGAMTPADFDPRFEYGGMISLLHNLGDDRLVTV